MRVGSGGPDFGCRPGCHPIAVAQTQAPGGAAQPEPVCFPVRPPPYRLTRLQRFPDMRHSAAPSVILVTVTPLLAAFGSTRWSWLAGPIAATAVRALGGAAGAGERVSRSGRRSRLRRPLYR